jgi:Flp pilus assembly protein TadG
MIRTLHGYLTDERGAAAVEMALVLPVLSLFVAGLLDLGIMAFEDVQATAAARAGAQYGANYALQNGYAVSGTDTAVTTGVATAMPSGTPATISGQSDYLYCICVPTDGSSLGVATSCASSCAGGQQLNTYVGVTVSTSGAIPLSFLGLGRNPTVTGQAIVRVK